MTVSSPSVFATASVATPTTRSIPRSAAAPADALRLTVPVFDMQRHLLTASIGLRRGRD
jgi:hypothetical protein